MTMIGGKLAGLDLPGLATLLGVTCREYVAIAQSDPRIVAEPMTAESLAWIRAWIALGMPDADLSKLVFYGDPTVRAIIVAVLATLPKPARWHAVTNVLWIEIGRSTAAGFMACAPGRTHVIALNGRTSDALLGPVIAHELAHAIHRAAEPVVAEPMTAEEHTARVLAVAQDAGWSREHLIRIMYRQEDLANGTARAWGYECAVDGLAADRDRKALLHDELEAARGRAAEITAEMDRDFPREQPNESAAACVAATNT
ncbi:MAG: hypothetical protein ABI467_11345 [Kofleriaceae bacterium]